MRKKSFLPTNAGERMLWLNNFSAKLPNYAAKYGITAADMTDTAAGAEYFAYWLDYKNQHLEYQKKLTQFLLEIAAGDTNSVAPAAPTVGTAPAAVLPGIFTRANYLAVRIKSHQLYTPADGNDLGLEGAEQTPPTTDIQPVITLRKGSGGHPEIVWTKMGMDALEIWKDSGNGVFALLDIDLTPNYTDPSPLPAAPAHWKYKAIYRKDSNHFGQWSEEVSVSV
jgi:hypothetical protein